MKEWVETLRSKLREMKIISPKENVYSKLPETRQPLLPTRDPMSPLPPPPAEIPPAIVPGVEVTIPIPLIQSEPVPSTSASSDLQQTSNNIVPAQTSQPASPAALSTVLDSDCSDSNESSSSSFTLSHNLPLSNTTSRSIMNLLTNPVQALTAQSRQKSQNHQQDGGESSKNSHSIISSNSELLPFTSSPEQNLNFDFNIPPESQHIKFSTSLASTSSGPSDNISDVEDSSVKILKIPRPQTTKSSEKKTNTSSITTTTATSAISIASKINNNNNKSLPVSSVKENNVSSDTGSSNITIIQLTNTTTTPHESPTIMSPQIDTKSTATTNNNDDSFNVHIIPSSSSSSIIHQTPKLITVVATDTNHQTTKIQVNSPLKSPNFSSVTNISVGGASANQEYESVFFPSSASKPQIQISTSSTTTSNIEPVNTPTTSNLSRHFSLGSSDTNQSSSTSRDQTKVDVKSIQPTKSSSSSKIPEHLSRILTRGLTEVNLSRASRVDRNKNLRLVTAESINNTASSSVTPSNSQSEMKVIIEKLKKDSHEQRRRSSSASEANSTNRVPGSGDHSMVHGGSNGNRHFGPTPSRMMQQNVGRLTLREQQVLQLKTEMRHPGGVRLQLRRKDCIGSIAWVDAFGSVW